MTPHDRALFVSLRPAYAEMILSGVKTVELRRIRPNVALGTLVLIYASSPTSQVLGTCVVEHIGSGTPDEIWELHGTRTGIGRAAFRSYFTGTNHGVAITVANPRRLQDPLHLDALRRQGFSPPQSFRYIPQEDAQALLAPQVDVCELRATPSTMPTLLDGMLAM